MNVLVVSSQPKCLEEGLDVLTQNGLIPHIRGTVDEACAASRTLTPSLVILDAELVPGDIVSTCQTLHDISRAPVIVVFQGELDPADAAAYFDAGAGARLSKGVSPILLLTWAQALTRKR